MRQTKFFYFFGTFWIFYDFTFTKRVWKYHNRVKFRISKFCVFWAFWVPRSSKKLFWLSCLCVCTSVRLYVCTSVCTMGICVRGFSKMAGPIFTKFILNVGLDRDQVWKEYGDDQPQGCWVTALRVKFFQNFEQWFLEIGLLNFYEIYTKSVSY